MSETSKMGLFGSKEGNSSPNDGQLSKDESPDRYAPYSVDSDAETYDTEALSIMDINDIIGVQAEPVGESTLESEIAALSEIITDAEINSTPDKSTNIDKDTVSVKINSPENLNKKDSVTLEKCDNSSVVITSDKPSDESNLNVNDKTVVDDEKISIESRECTKQSKDLPMEKGMEAIHDSSNMKDVPGMSKSLQLIGEAYISDDSQEIESTDGNISKEPKVIFSCKPLVDKQLSHDTEKNHFDAVTSVKTTNETENVSTISPTQEDTVESSIDNDESKNSEPLTVKSVKADAVVTESEPIEQKESVELMKVDDHNDPTDSTDNEQSEILNAEIVESSDEIVTSVEDVKSLDVVTEENDQDEVEESKSECQETVVSEDTNEVSVESSQAQECESSTTEEVLETVENVPQIDEATTNKDIPMNVDEDTKEIIASEEHVQETEDAMEVSITEQSTLISDAVVEDVVPESITDPVVDTTPTDTTEMEVDEPEAVELESNEIDKKMTREDSPQIDETTVTIRTKLEEKCVIEEEISSESHDEPEETQATTPIEASVQPESDVGKIEKVEQVKLENIISQLEETSDAIPENSLDAIMPENQQTSLDNQIDNRDEKSENELGNNDIESQEIDEEPAINSPIKSLEVDSTDNLPDEVTLELENLPSEQTVNVIEQVEDICPTIDNDIVESAPEEPVISEEKIPAPDTIEDILETESGASADPILGAQQTPDDDDDDAAEDLPLATTAIDELADIGDAKDSGMSLSIDQLEDPIATESVDTLDSLLDLIPTVESIDVDESEINSPNESSVNVDKQLETEMEKENETKVETMEVTENLESNIQDSDCIAANLLPEVDIPFGVIDGDKLEIPDNILADTLANVDPVAEVPQTNPEISEIESAVKFLQESEDNDVESPELSPKITKNEVDNSTEREDTAIVYTPAEEISEETSELAVDLDSIVSDPIAISEAEIINEAAKLENEKKQQTTDAKISSMQDTNLNENSLQDTPELLIKKIPVECNDKANIELKPMCTLPIKSIIPKTSILEERLKEPPKIEIPNVESARVYDSPKTNLLIPRDARMQNYHKLLESPKAMSRDDVKIVDTPRKDPERHDLESVGSPRIILKIAKSALADCAEPRSPKSPKIRSATNSPNPDDSPGQKLGKIKLKLSKSGHPSIISNDNVDEAAAAALQWHTEAPCSVSPLGMKIKLSKTGDASIVQSEKFDSTDDRRLESPLGMKIKLSKSGDGSIVQQDAKEASKHKLDGLLDSPKRTDSPLGMKFKLSKSGDASIIQPDKHEDDKRTDSPLGMKIKLHKTGDASILPSDYEEGKIKDKSEFIHDNQKRTDSPIGMKIKLTKKGGSSVVSLDSNESKDKLEVPDTSRRTESPLGIKLKLSKSGDASIIHSETTDDKDRHRSELTQISASVNIESSSGKDCDAISGTPKRSESSIGMKFKLSKDGDATIVHSDRQEDDQEPRRMDSTMKIKLSKTGHPTIVASDSELTQKFKESESSFALASRSELTIEPIQSIKRTDIDTSKRKEITLSPIETKKTKLEAKLSQMLPEVTFQPVIPKDHKSGNFQSNTSLISREQMNVISQEISITQLRPNKSAEREVSMGEKLKSMLSQSSTNPSDDCEIIEPHPELIIVNENSNSSQDIMIIDEVPALRLPEPKTPKKRGRPRRNAIQFQQPSPSVPRDPLAMDEVGYQRPLEPRENERPKRTCRNQRSYAPPKRGRGRGRGKRKYERHDSGPAGKRARYESDLSPSSVVDNCTMITLEDESTVRHDSSELYKALRQPLKSSITPQDLPTATIDLSGSQVPSLLNSRLMSGLEDQEVASVSGKINQTKKAETKETFGAPDRQNWLAPASKKFLEINRNDGMSTIQVIDEETRMSAEPTSRSQTPARNLAVQAETIVNEESQGSVLSTATTESEKVKVKNRRMEINFDPDEGPFTVDKIAEYEWPPDRKGETFMIQEQISQYLGVKSFKRKYPDLKRRMVDMEERNYLRENVLVSEGMCDMGLTAICSPEVLDIMCSDFPDQYEEYRKHMREKQIKEHSKKQKELSAAATAEKNRIDLAEMAVQSALSWNVNLNKARKELRRCSLDLQTFTIHVPKKQQKVEEVSRVSHYPVALIPGQYTDYYREYTPAELRYYPLNTVLYGPMRPNERKFDSQSEGSQSDSDSDSSSDDSSCSSSEGTQDTEESQSTMDDVDIELSNQKDKSLKCKMCLKNLNKNNKNEILIQCGTCNGHVHPSCIDLTLDMVPHIQAYAWQCTDCKTCVQCHDPADEDKMLFCDMCDRGYHIYCVGLRRVPQGRWHCQECAICASCGSREAAGMNADRNSVAQWQHEYKKGDKNTRVYVSTLCVPCSKLWRKGRYCPHCSRCHTVPRLDLEENLVHCSACDKYLHLDCVESKDLIIGRKNYQCDVCIQSRQRLVKSSASKVIRA